MNKQPTVAVLGWAPWAMLLPPICAKRVWRHAYGTGPGRAAKT